MFVCVCVRVPWACCLSEDGLFSLSSLLQMMVVDGDSGSVIWNYTVPCHLKRTPTSSAVTSDQKSVFLFWAEGLPAAPSNSVSEPGRVPLSLCGMVAALWGWLGLKVSLDQPHLQVVVGRTKQPSSGQSRSLLPPELCFPPLPFSHTVGQPTPAPWLLPQQRGPARLKSEFTWGDCGREDLIT